jgi:SAM-dependent methyltransferase
MGISLAAVHLLKPTLERLGDPAHKRVLTLGVQDCHFSLSELRTFLHKHHIPHRDLPDSEVELTNGFRWADPAQRALYANCIHQRTLFRLLGFSAENIHAMDVSPYEGADVIHDLNEPVDARFAGQFDLVYDGGTIEHVFSLKDALWNLMRMCKVGGFVVNHTPADYVNHGFVNVGADLFRDFYWSNGFEQVGLDYIAVPMTEGRRNRYYLRFAPESFRHSLQPFYGTTLFSSFQKIQESALQIPSQGCYASRWADGSDTGAPTETESASSGRGRLRELLRRAIDSNYVTSTLVRNHLALRRGERVAL